MSIWPVCMIHVSLLVHRTEHADLALLVLRLLKLALPFIKPEQASREGATRNGPSSSAILSYLSTLLDKECEQQLPAVKRLAEEIVVKGVAIFFPDSVARRTHLLEMIGSVLSESQPRSWWLQFEALCHYFSTSDANSLLGLPSMFKEVFASSANCTDLSNRHHLCRENQLLLARLWSSW